MNTAFRIMLVGIFICAAVCANEQAWKELSSQVIQLYKQGRYQEAVPVAQRALQLARSAYGENDERVAASLNNLAEL
ncbi:tetratricopeptide repeat protein, partial [bacterium]|nr:tetratricopeptide repeat protein [bacterium]